MKSSSGSLLLGMAIAGALFLNVANALLLLLGWVFYSLLKEKNTDVFAGGAGLLMLVLAGWLTITQFWSGVGAIGWFTTWIFMAISLAFVGWQSCSGRQPDLWRFTQIFLGLLGCLIAIWGIAQLAVQGHTRATGPLTDPNTYGCLLNLLWFPLFASFVAAKNNRTVLLCGAALLVIHLALMMSGSRAASLIWLLLCAVMVVLHWSSITRERLAFVCVMAAGNYFIFSIFSSHLMLSSYGAAFDVLQTSQPAASPRFLMWQSTFRMWLDAPWFGSGLGSWSYLYPMYRIPDETGTSGYYAHNDYLQLLQEGGIFTLLIFAGVLGWMGVYGVKAWRRMPAGAERIENAGILAGIAAATLHAFVNFTFYLIYINILIGLYLGRLFQAQGRFSQEIVISSSGQAVRLQKIAIFALIAINGFNAFFSSTSLALLRNESWGVRMVQIIAPQFSQFSAAALLASVRPSDTTAQRYIVASIENGIIGNPAITRQQAGEMFREVVDGYELLHAQNQYDAATPANEAAFLISFDRRYGVDQNHMKRARELLQESLHKDPSRADSAMLLAETFFIEGHTQQGFDALAATVSNAWRERDRMMIEAEILKHKIPEYAGQLSGLQQELRGMRLHCGTDECGMRHAKIEMAARETLNRMETGQLTR